MNSKADVCAKSEIGRNSFSIVTLLHLFTMAPWRMRLPSKLFPVRMHRLEMAEVADSPIPSVSAGRRERQSRGAFFGNQVEYGHGI
jgi:hypothetical protein